MNPVTCNEIMDPQTLTKSKRMLMFFNVSSKIGFISLISTSSGLKKIYRVSK